MILAFIAAAVGFSGIKVGLINGKAFLYTVVYQVLELAAAGTAGTLTICNLTEADANTLKAAIGGEVIASPDVDPVIYQRKPASLPAVGGGSLLVSNRRQILSFRLGAFKKCRIPRRTD